MKVDQYVGRFLDGRYEILELIGTGGMAVVYKARCHRLNRLVAIKILKDEFAGDEEFRRRFRAEGEAVAMLSHPNIVQVFDVSSTDGANFIVMELIDGISLKQYMEKKGVLNWKETLHFAMQIATGLEHAHSRGIVHRDIKPHNVMVLKDGSVKVMDFGIARVMNKSNTLTKEALGSVHYISPEQAKGGHTDNRSDIYSLGVVMYEMMAGRPPYDGESAVSVAIQHINGGAPLPSTMNPNIPVGMEQIIMKAMALEISDRYDSATEMLRDMEEFRKNPEITFQYTTMVAAETRPIPVTTAPRTTAERKVMQKTGVKPEPASRQVSIQQRVAASNAAAKEAESVRRAVERRKNKQKEQKEERSRVATTAIVVVSAVVIFAIIIFLVALFNGALLNQERDLVDVPYLEGVMYGDGFSERYSDFTIRLQPQQYSDSYPEKQIMSQTPAGGTRVQKGSDIWITVSMGAEPPVKYMDNLVDVDAAQAVAALEAQGFVVYTRQETSYITAVGQVVHTDPSAGAELTKGQSVYLYISSGPDIVESTMPYVVGMELDRALEILEQMGFTNVRPQAVDNPRPRDEVVFQSVEKNQKLDVNSEITLHYSKGGTPETEAPTEAPTETQPQPRTMTVTFSVPEKESEYTLEVCPVGTRSAVATQKVSAGATSATVELTGTGVERYDLYVDGEFIWEQKVDFGNG